MRGMLAVVACVGCGAAPRAVSLTVDGSPSAVWYRDGAGPWQSLAGSTRAGRVDPRLRGYEAHAGELDFAIPDGFAPALVPDVSVDHGRELQLVGDSGLDFTDATESETAVGP